MIQHHKYTNLSSTTDVEETEIDLFYDDPQHLLELTTKKAVLYIIQHEMQKYKVKKNPEYQSSLASQCIWSRAKANRLFSKEHTCQSKHPCQQPKRWLYRQTSPDSQYQNHIDYVFLQPKVEKLCTVSKSKTWSWLWLRFRVLTTKFRPKLKKVGETTRLFRCDLN